MSGTRIKYFESHAHYDDKRFGDRKDLLEKVLPDAGVGLIINVGASMESSEAGVKLAEEYDYVYASVGVHPHDVKDVTDKDLDALLVMSKRDKVVAIGEIGLDFHYDNSDRDTQRKRFADQLEVAMEANLPVIIHSREADYETFKIVRESGIAKCGGVVHCYSGGPDLALEYSKMEFYIGFGGVLTFTKTAETVKAAQILPLDRILIETDCPYLAPAPNRGKRNDSSNLFHICEKLAQIRGLTHEETARVTWENGMRLFGI